MSKKYDMSRRQFFSLLGGIPLIGGYLAQFGKPPLAARIGDEFTVVNGWILKKSDMQERGGA